MFDDHFGVVNEVIIQESISSDSVSVILSESIEERVNLNPISFHQYKSKQTVFANNNYKSISHQLKDQFLTIILQNEKNLL